MKVSVIGLGLIGCERLKALSKLRERYPQIEIGKLYDTDPADRSMNPLFEKAQFAESVQEVVLDRPDWAIVCVPHGTAVDVATPFLQAGTNVLLEKPLGRNLAECDGIIESIKQGAQLYVGFNYRFFRGIRMLLRDVYDGRFGTLISINLVLGHGNAPGMEKSWKLDPVACGGGCLIDPGIHLLDLVNMVAKRPPRCIAATGWNGFWKTGIEEEVHALFRDDRGCIYNLQASLNRWRSEFHFSVNGTDGYGVVEGRGRSYGPQTYRVGRRWAWQQGKRQADTEILEVSDSGEDSFADELEALLIGASMGASPCVYSEARNNMLLLGETYAKLQSQ